MSDNRVLAPMPTSAFIHDLVRSDTNIVITFSVNLFFNDYEIQKHAWNLDVRVFKIADFWPQA